MFSWPLPPYVVHRFPDVTNVGQLLSRFVASPGDFASASLALFQIIAFAGAFLGSRVEDRSVAGWQDRAAQSWFQRSLPSWTFSTRVEELIRGVGTVP